MNKHGFSTLPTLKKKTHSLCYYSKALLNKGLERSSLNFDVTGDQSGKLKVAL